MDKLDPNKSRLVEVVSLFAQIQEQQDRGGGKERFK